MPQCMCGDERPYRCGSQIGKKNERKKSLECVLRVCVCIEKGSYIYACNIFKKAVFNFLHIVNQYKHAHILKLKWMKQAGGTRHTQRSKKKTPHSQPSQALHGRRYLDSQDENLQQTQKARAKKKNVRTNINIGIIFKCVGYIVISCIIILGKFLRNIYERGWNDARITSRTVNKKNLLRPGPCVLIHSASRATTATLCSARVRQNVFA